MDPITPQPLENARLIVFAKDQPEYTPLPAYVTPDGLAMTEWALTAEELAALVNGGHIRLWAWTFNRPLQPVALQVVEPSAEQDGR